MKHKVITNIVETKIKNPIWRTITFGKIKGMLYFQWEAKNTYGTGCFMLMNTGTDMQLSTQTHDIRGITTLEKVLEEILNMNILDEKDREKIKT